MIGAQALGLENPMLSILIPAKVKSHNLRPTVESLVRFFEKDYAGRFEIILALNGNDADIEDFHSAPSSEIHSLRQDFPSLKLVTSSPAGKGLALKKAFEGSSGSYILWTDADLPFELDFFTKSIKLLEAGRDFVSGSRRHPESRFEIAPVAEAMVQRRKRVSLIFNFFVRNVLGLESRDTQCGIKAMRREFAEEAFGRQLCSGFLADLEYFLVCRGSGAVNEELPIHWRVQDEKSTVRLSSQIFISSSWLLRITWANLLGRYRAALKNEDAKKLTKPTENPYPNLLLTSDDWGISPGVNEGILALAKEGVVQRVSVLADGPYIQHRLDELLAVPGIKVGLHFALSYPSKALEERKLGSMKLFALWLANPFQSVKAKARLIREEWERQIGIMEKAKIPLSYVDSHHHVHIFPLVNQVLFPLIAEKGFRTLRWPFDARLFFSGKCVLNLLSLAALPSFKRSKLERRPFFYPSLAQFHRPLNLRDQLTRFSEKMGPSAFGEVIVHPAAYEDFSTLGIQDSYSSQRVVEFNALKLMASLGRGANS